MEGLVSRLRFVTLCCTLLDSECASFTVVIAEVDVAGHSPVGHQVSRPQRPVDAPGVLPPAGAGAGVIGLVLECLLRPTLISLVHCLSDVQNLEPLLYHRTETLTDVVGLALHHEYE